MRLPTTDLLLDWLEEFRNLNLGPESDTARGRAEHEMPAQETTSTYSQGSINPRRIPPVFSVAKSTKRDGRPHSTASSHLTIHSVTKGKSSRKQSQAVSALSGRGYMKLATKRYQNFNTRKNKRKAISENGESNGVRAIRIFNPAFNADLTHGNYEKARRSQTSKKFDHSIRTVDRIPTSKTPHGARPNRIFSRGLDLSHQQLVDSIGHNFEDPKDPEDLSWEILAWGPAIRFRRWDFGSVVWRTPLSEFGLCRSDNSVSKQMVNEGPRMATASGLIAETLDDLEVLFAPFRLLPTELRLHIWQMAGPEPRIVRLLKSKYYPAVYSKTPIPGMLHACRESHDVALQWYKLMFTRELHDEEVFNKRFCYPRTYFDPEADIFYAGCEACYSLACCECRPLISSMESYFIRKVLFHWEKPIREHEIKPYYSLSNFSEHLEEVMILGPGTKALRAGTGFDQLVKSIAQFHWQEKPTLLEDCLKDFRRWEYTTVEVVTRVELVND